MLNDYTYFVPRTASYSCQNLLKFCYICVACSCIAIFIVGITETDSMYVAISVIIALSITCGSCIFSRCYDKSYYEKNKLISNNEGQQNIINKYTPVEYYPYQEGSL